MSDPLKPLVEDHVYADEGSPEKPPQVQARADAFARKVAAEQADLAQVLKTEAGQALVMRILEHCGVYRSTLLSNETVQYAQAEGRRAVALWLIREVSQLGPEVYPTLLINHARRAQKAADVDAGAAKVARS